MNWNTDQFYAILSYYSCIFNGHFYIQIFTMHNIGRINFYLILFSSLADTTIHFQLKHPNILNDNLKRKTYIYIYICMYVFTYTYFFCFFIDIKNPIFFLWFTVDFAVLSFLCLHSYFYNDSSRISIHSLWQSLSLLQMKNKCRSSLFNLGFNFISFLLVLAGCSS